MSGTNDLVHAAEAAARLGNPDVRAALNLANAGNGCGTCGDAGTVPDWLAVVPAN